MAAKTKSKATKLETSKPVKSSETILKLADEKSSLVFKVLSFAKTKKVIEVRDVDQLEVIVSEILNLHDTTYGLRECITLDYYVSGLWWCRQQNFSIEQTSAFFTILSSMIKNVEKQVTLVDNVLELRQMLADEFLDGTESAGSGPTNVFNTHQAKHIIDYFRISLFQHHKLYDCYFQSPSKDFILSVDMELKVPKPADLPWPAPLGEAISDEDMKLYLKDDTDKAAQMLADAEERQRLEAQKEVDAKLEECLLAQLSTEEIKKIITSVYSEMLAGVEEDIATKIKEKENALISRINQIQIVARTYHGARSASPR